MALLTIIRHGQSTYNLQNLFTGNVDVPLTALGETEAKLAGQKLSSYTFDCAYTSMLIRAWQSLTIILETIQQPNITVIKNAALNERIYGSLQGLNKAATIEKYGAAQVERWRRSYHEKPPNGESLEDTYNRTLPYYQREIEPKLKANQNILIVAHGNSLRALMMYLENINPTSIAAINIATGVPRVYKFNSAFEVASVANL
jgi:2,3-bisphosphoglycerate-dependent phosphoglycerate mutase